MHNWGSIPPGTLAGPSEELCKISLRIVFSVGPGAGAFIRWISPLTSWGLLLGMLYWPLLTSWLCGHLWPPENVWSRRAGAAVFGTWGGASHCACSCPPQRCWDEKRAEGMWHRTHESLALRASMERTWWPWRPGQVLAGGRNASGFSLEMVGWVKTLVP